MNPTLYVQGLSELNFEHTFNPYSNRCVVHDREDAPQRRSQTLLRILERAAKEDIDSIWIGRDLGYRGGRRTGLALTDDAHFHDHTKRWKLSVERPTKGDIVAEQTAAVTWKVVSRIKESIFLWNIFPLHPHKFENPFSNRRHNSLERRAGEEFLVELIHLLRPQRLIAIGNDAAQTAHRLANRQNVVQVRHPSYGGQMRFFAQVGELYDLP